MHRFSADIVARARRIKVLLLDVDGVLTDGTIFLDNNGLEAKAFNIKDGLGLTLLKRYGVPSGIITGRDSHVVTRRAEELGMEILVQGCPDKLAAVRKIAAANGWSLEQVAYVGDDLIDLPLLLQAGLAVTVADGVAEVRQRVHHVTAAPGGRGAVREVCELILMAQGRWATALAQYC
ncbi:MAG: HAD hydrolase family protein [Nitrospirota bacterium]|nr:HAD hydrolase family protein [Nitrospirota bacterium]